MARALPAARLRAARELPEGFDRLMLGSPRQGREVLSNLERVAQARGLLGDPLFMDAFLRLRMDVDDLSALHSRYGRVLERGAVQDPSAYGEGEVDVLADYFISRVASIYGGTNDIQRNVLARAVLNLPS